MKGFDLKNAVSSALKYTTIAVVGTAMYIASDKMLKTIDGGEKNEDR